jgi:hypothetical protein
VKTEPTTASSAHGLDSRDADAPEGGTDDTFQHRLALQLKSVERQQTDMQKKERDAANKKVESAFVSPIPREYALS